MTRHENERTRHYKWMFKDMKPLKRKENLAQSSHSELKFKD